MSMIERVAIGQADFDGRPWLSMSRGERERYKQRARAAIEEMGEPTEEMIDAGAKRASGFAGAGNRMCNGYRAMIHAALNEKPEG